MTTTPGPNPVLLFERAAPTRARVHVATAPAPGEGEVLVEIECFGLTANNLTYAVLGQALQYADFFPVPADVDGAREALLPVWGMATVRASRSAVIAEGARLYGYFPAARYALLTPAQGTPAGFRVERAWLPASHGVYHLYSEPDRDPFFTPGQEGLMVVMRPLFLTGLLFADYLAVHEFMGADAVLISSAGSKTAFGAAVAIRRQRAELPVIGLASTRAVAQASAFGVYDQVIAYDDLARLPTGRVLYADIAGSMPLRRALDAQLGERLVHHTQVGLTHWAEGNFGGEAGKAARDGVFFAPSWTARRRAELGSSFFASLSAGWHAQFAEALKHFHVSEERGGEAVAREFQALVDGRVEPTRAPVLRW